MVVVVVVVLELLLPLLSGEVVSELPEVFVSAGLDAGAEDVGAEDVGAEETGAEGTTTTVGGGVVTLTEVGGGDAETGGGVGRESEAAGLAGITTGAEAGTGWSGALVRAGTMTVDEDGAGRLK